MIPRSKPTFATELRDWRNGQKMTNPGLAAAIGVTASAVKIWLRGEVFPTDERCDKLFNLTRLYCFGDGREVARKSVPSEVRKTRQQKYKANAAVFRERSRRSWRKTYEAGQKFVEHAELEALRKDPRKRKEVCRVCGLICRDVGPHRAQKHPEISLAAYKEKYGFCRSRNATRSELTQEKQRTAMKSIGHQPPKWTRKLLAKAAAASLRTNRKGSARLEEQLNARGRTLGPRRQHWKRDRRTWELITDARIVRAKIRGWDLKRIASSVGLSMPATSFRLRRLGKSGRANAYLHGELVGPQQFRDYCSDFQLTVSEAARDVGVSEDWAYRRMNRQGDERPFSQALGSQLIRAREKRTASFRLKPAGPRGGRPSKLPASQRSDLRSKYPILLAELQSVHESIRKNGAPSMVALWDWMCVEFRARDCSC